MEGDQLPFPIRRVRWMYEAGGPSEEIGSDEILIPLRGSVEVAVETRPGSVQRITLDRPHLGLHVPRGSARRLERLSSGAVCLVLECDP